MKSFSTCNVWLILVIISNSKIRKWKWKWIGRAFNFQDLSETMPAKQSSPDASRHLLSGICYIRRVNNNYTNLFEATKKQKTIKEQKMSVKLLLLIKKN